VQQQHRVFDCLIEQELVMVMQVDENEDFEFFHQFLNYVHLFFYNLIEFLKNQILKK
jgi:hypothetical protein